MANWRVESTGHPKFPYRITLTEGSKITLSLLTQDKWPGQRGNIFCLRDTDEVEKHCVLVEECPVISLRRFGKKLAIILDRAS